MSRLEFLIVEDKEKHIIDLQRAIEDSVIELCYERPICHLATTREEAEILINDQVIDVAFIDLCLDASTSNDMTGVELAKLLKQRKPNAIRILVTAHFSSQIDTSMFADVIEKSEDYLTLTRRQLKRKLKAIVSKKIAEINTTNFSMQLGRKKMWALGRKAGSSNLELLSATIPLMPEDAVLVKTDTLGICGTDIHAFGDGKTTPLFDIIDFHEALGTVVWVGGHVEACQLHTGDIVVPIVRRCQTWPEPQSIEEQEPFIYGKCGEADDCPHYRRPDICENDSFSRQSGRGYLSRGTGRCHGFGSEYFIDTPEWLIKICNASEKEDMASNVLRRFILTEPLAVVWKMYREIARIRPTSPFKDKMLTLGMGPIGYLATILMHTMHPGLHCSAVGRDPKGVKWIDYLSIGIKPEISYYHLPEESWHYDITGKYDIIIEATGKPLEVIDKAIDHLRPNGVLVILSVVENDSSDFATLLPHHVDAIVRKNCMIIGSVNEARDDFENAVSFIKTFHSDSISPLDYLTNDVAISSNVVNDMSALREKHMTTRETRPKVVLYAPINPRNIIDVL